MKRMVNRKGLIISLITASVVLILLTGFFSTHFYPGTEINGVNVSFKTAEASDKKLSNRTNSFVLVLYERGNGREAIKGSEIRLNLRYESSIFKAEQNKTIWLFSFFNESSVHFDSAFIFDEYLLKDRIGKLDCMNPSKVIAPKNAALVYSDGVYSVVKEVNGNKINELKFYPSIKKALTDGRDQLDLEKLRCYDDPKIRADSQKIRNTIAEAEGYLAARIIYTFPAGNQIVGENEISQWIEFDSDLTIVFNKKKVKDYLITLASQYNTCGKERDFKTSLGTMIKIGGGDYGWKMDVGGETEALIQEILSGKTMEKKPMFSQKGAAYDINDIGLTYVEIDLSKQHLWYYKDGKLIAHGSVVTGNVKKGHKTPEGIYSLKYRIRNAVLKGENYRSKVSYWMPFNNDIGIHDAKWRTQFGGSIYLSRGSHGCINAPYYLAEKIFNNIAVGTPIICYY